MVNWKDRKYVNPRKRVFKNMDTDEILNLEIQDDLDNIEEESTTPLNAHNLNMAQQDLLDDMSKTYTGTNITGPTVEGYGTIHKLYGHTIEEGTGEKSPSNPYALKCVADDVNLYNENSSKVGSFIDGSGAEVSGSGYLFINQIIIPTALKYTMSYNEATQNANVRFSYYNNNTFLSREVGHDNKHIFTIPANCTKIDVRVDTGVDYFKGLKLQKGSTATPYSPYGYGTVEIISQNGDQQSSNTVLTKPLCSLQDNKGNIIAQDYIDYTKGVVHRECGYVVLDGNTNISYMDTSNNTARFMVALDNVKSITTYKCDKLKVLKQSEAGDEECVIIRDLSSDNIVNIRVKRDRLSEVSTAGIKNYLSSNPITLIYQLATPTTEPLNCSNKIVQYADETTVSNRDNAEIEVSLTNNKAISEVNGELGRLRDDVNKINEYSTEEQVVGTWIDGKPIYRKVIQVTTLTDGLLKLSIPIDKMVDLRGKLIQNDMIHYIIPGLIINYVQGTGNVVTSISVSFLNKNSWSPNSIYVVTDKTINNVSGYEFVIKYTKTTD